MLITINTMICLKRFLVFIFILVLAPSISQSKVNQIENSAANVDGPAFSQELKVGQLFFIGLGKDIEELKVREIIRKFGPGGFILFKAQLKSKKQIQKLTSLIKKESMKVTGQIPFIGVDQEGGSVSRIPSVESFPSLLAIGTTGDADLAKEYGRLVGNELNELGINVNFSPVLDLLEPNVEKDFIGTRSFGSDAELVSRISSAYAQGLWEAGVIPAGKHFPGIGGSSVDPHYEFMTFKGDLTKLIGERLRPFKAFAEISIPSFMMTSHISLPSVDKSSMPAGFSRLISHDLLRGQLNYKGLVITDDLEMGGAKLFGSPLNAVKKAIYAGSDMVMFSEYSDEQEETLTKAHHQKFISELSIETINSRVQRILEQKAAIASYVPAPRTIASEGVAPTDTQINATSSISSFNSKLLESLFKTQLKDFKAKARVTVIADDMKFAESFGSQFDGDTEYISSSDVIDKKIKGKFCDECSLLVVVKNRRQQKMLPKIFSEVQKDVLVINEGPPLTTSQQNSKSRVLNIYYKHKKTGSELARYLNNNLSEK
jgi:beta-glucosidase-like glycosyl hydrolase